MPTIYELAAEHRARLLRRERTASSAMIRTYGETYRRIRGEVDRLTAQIQAARTRGEVVKPAWLYRLGRLDELRATTLREINQYSQYAEQSIIDQQQAAVTAATEDAAALGQAALEAAPEEVTLTTSFQRLPVQAVVDLVGNLSDGSPLNDLLRRLAPAGWEAIQDALVVGLATGLSPREIARQIRSAAAVPLSRSLTIARTEVLRAYRESSRRSYEENRNLLQGWIWQATLGPRTCPACIAMHGTLHSVEDKLDGHPNCRCSMVPRTKSWEELGFEDIPDTRPSVETGEDFLRGQPEATQRRILGNQGFEAWRDGRVDLQDFVRRTHDDRWGSMRSSRTARQAIEHHSEE